MAVQLLHDCRVFTRVYLARFAIADVSTFIT